MARYIHRRNIRFKNEIANADKSKILGVAIDPSSNFHRVVIFNFLGEIIGEPFSINTLKTGFDLLIKNVDKAKKRIKYAKIYVAIESTGTYSENIYNHLSKFFKNVVIIPPLATANNRKQKSLHGLKSDDIDCGAIGDLLIRGEFTKSTPHKSLYYRLRNLIYWREKKIVMMVMLKNQITFRISRCFPGLNCEFEENKPIYTNPNTNHLYQGLMNNYMTGQEYLETCDEDLYEKFNYKDSYTKRNSRIKQFKNRLKEMLLPDENLARVHLDILSIDVKFIRFLENELNIVEKQIVELGKRTPAIYLMGQIKGISDLYASMYVGLIGDYRKYKSARNIYSLSGLSPAIHQSGSMSMSRSTGIKRAGNKILRALLFNLARSVILSDPYFKDYYNKIKSEKNRNWKINFIAVSRKLNNVLFALMRDKSNYNRESHRKFEHCELGIKSEL